MELLINQEFRSLIPDLDVSEKKMLEESILEEGVRDALVLWNGYIVDGHNRYDIITKHNITDYRIINKHFKDKDEAKIWIKRNQIARRNISIYLRGEYSIEVAEWENKRKAAKERINPANRLQRDKLGRYTPVSVKSQKQVVDNTKILAGKLNIGEQAASRIIQILQYAWITRGIYNSGFV